MLTPVWQSGRCHPFDRREARAGWPPLLALKPGERSRDRVRLTMPGRSTAPEKRPALDNLRAKLLVTAFDGARRVATIADVGVKNPRPWRRFGRGDCLRWVEQLANLKSNKSDEMIFWFGDHGQKYSLALSTIWVIHFPTPLACLNEHCQPWYLILCP